MATMNISLPDQMKSYIEDQVASGLYANASDFVRDLIRDRVAKRDALLAALEEGEASGISDRSLDEIVEQEFAKLPSE